MSPERDRYRDRRRTPPQVSPAICNNNAATERSSVESVLHPRAAMNRLSLGVPLLVLTSACGTSGPAVPSGAPLNIGGTWRGTVSTQPAGESINGLRLQGATVTVTIAQSGESVSGEFAVIGMSLAFSGLVDADSFEGTLELTGSNGCTASSRLSGDASPTALRLSAVIGTGCGYLDLVQLELTERQ
jgi:hypothetical protein